MLLERIAMYDQYFPRALEHIGANCTAIDEEWVELLNSKVPLETPIYILSWSNTCVHVVHTYIWIFAFSSVEASSYGVK